MKRFLNIFFVLAATLLIFSCNALGFGSTTVNNSSLLYNITFKWSDGGKEEILAIGESSSINYDVTEVIIVNPSKRVTQEYNDNIIIIKDIIPYSIYVENLSSVAITLKADGWLENEMIVPSGKFENSPSQKGLIYTDTPKFTVTAAAGYNFPLILNYNFYNNIFYVKIF